MFGSLIAGARKRKLGSKSASSGAFTFSLVGLRGEGISSGGGGMELRSTGSLGDSSLNLFGGARISTSISTTSGESSCCGCADGDLSVIGSSGGGRVGDHGFSRGGGVGDFALTGERISSSTTSSFLISKSFFTNLLFF